MCLVGLLHAVITSAACVPRFIMLAFEWRFKGKCIMNVMVLERNEDAAIPGHHVKHAHSQSSAPLQDSEYAVHGGQDEKVSTAASGFGAKMISASFIEDEPAKKASTLNDPFINFLQQVGFTIVPRPISLRAQRCSPRMKHVSLEFYAMF
jgi:hypothetical protein